MSDDNMDCNSMPEGETTVVGEDNQELDSGYQTPNSVYEMPINNTNTIEVDGTVKASGSGEDAGSNMALRCDGCKNHYDSHNHVASTGDCGHAQCTSCWKMSNNLCSTCHNYSSNMQPAYPLTSRDMMSPEPIDEPMEPSSMSKGVILKSSTNESSGTNMTKVTASTAPMSKGVILSAHNGTANTLTGVKVKPSPPSTSASDMAQVKIKCMNGTTLQENVNTTTTVGGMKRAIHQKTGISYERQHLLHQGRTMTDTKPLNSYNVANGSTIQMAERCSGG